MILALFRQRVVLAGLVRADLRERYSGSMVGWLWNVLHPLAQISVYGVVFSTVMSGRGQGFARPLDYVLFLCVGLFPWLAFSEAVSRGTTALIGGAAQLRQGVAQEEMLPAKIAISAAISAATALAVLLIASPLLGRPPALTWLLIPVPVLALMALALGAALSCAVLAVFFRDLIQLVQILLPVALWTTPIIYAPGILPGWIASWAPWHPLYPPFTMLHDLYLQGRMPEPWLWLPMLCWPVLAMAIGSMLTSRLRSDVRDAL